MSDLLRGGSLGQHYHLTEEEHAKLALGSIAARTVYTSGTAQTHNFQSGIACAIVEAIAGGGGGGSGNDVGNGGGGGAAGGYFSKRLTSALTSLTYTVGAGGAGGAAGQNHGVAGGDTVIVHDGTTYTAKGGNRGTFTGDGGAGVEGSGGDIASPGAPGGYGMQSSFYYDGETWVHQRTSGAGGSSMFGGGGRGRISETSRINGAAATGYGAGGAGGLPQPGGYTASGGNGSGGLVIITEFR